MFLLTQQQQPGGNEEAQHGDVGYANDGLQEQLLRKLNRSHVGASSSQQRPLHGSQRHDAHAAAAAAQHTARRRTSLLHQQEAGDGGDGEASPCEGPAGGMHDLLGDLLTQAQAAADDDEPAAASHHHHHQHSREPAAAVAWGGGSSSVAGTVQQVNSSSRLGWWCWHD
jgi:hypothetical protein